MLLQDSPAPTGSSDPGLLDSLGAIGWVDWTAITLLSVFFLIGLFKGFWWQFTRILTLLAAWYLAGQFGPQGEGVIAGWFDPSTSPQDLPLFLSYVAIFVIAVIVFSIIAMLLQRLVRDAPGLTFLDRVGGAVMGLGTGAIGVLAILAGLYMFVPASFGIVEAAQRSASMKYSQQAIAMMGGLVPQPMQKVFDVGGERPSTGAKAVEPGANEQTGKGR